MKSKKIIANILFVICFSVFTLHLKPVVDLYTVHGVDVSHYQGEIDWQKLHEQGFEFAFIKATEGSSHVDGCFYKNWQNVAKTPILASAYHFFSYDSSGITQAENFISTVGKRSGMLPPVIDVEFYGDYYKNPKNSDDAKDILNDLLYELERYYGTKPIIYATRSAYDLYIKDTFEDYPLWIRNTYYPPHLDATGHWIFWQYSDKGQISGHESDYIDLNVFRGTTDDLKKMALN